MVYAPPNRLATGPGTIGAPQVVRPSGPGTGGASSLPAAPLPATSDAIQQQIAQYLSSIQKSLDALAEAYTFDPSERVILSYPDAGGLRAVPGGVTTVDLLAGQIRRPDITEAIPLSLKSVGAPFVKNMSFFVDSDVDIQLYRAGQRSGAIHARQCGYYNLKAEVDSMIVNGGGYPFNLMLVATTLLDPIATVISPTAFCERFGTATSDIAYAAVPVGPTGGGALGAGYLNGVIFTGYLNSRTLTVSNTGNNTVNINLQLLLSTSQTWADDPSTGSAYALTAGNTALITTTTPSQFMRLRIQDGTAGNHSTVSVQFIGFAT